MQVEFRRAETLCLCTEIPRPQQNLYIIWSQQLYFNIQSKLYQFSTNINQNKDQGKDFTDQKLSKDGFQASWKQAWNNVHRYIWGFHEPKCSFLHSNRFDKHYDIFSGTFLLQQKQKVDLAEYKWDSQTESASALLPRAFAEKKCSEKEQDYRPKVTCLVLDRQLFKFQWTIILCAIEVFENLDSCSFIQSEDSKKFNFVVKKFWANDEFFKQIGLKNSNWQTLALFSHFLDAHLLLFYYSNFNNGTNSWKIFFTGTENRFVSCLSRRFIQ